MKHLFYILNIYGLAIWHIEMLLMADGLAFKWVKVLLKIQKAHLHHQGMCVCNMKPPPPPDLLRKRNADT